MLRKVVTVKICIMENGVVPMIGYNRKLIEIPRQFDKSVVSGNNPEYARLVLFDLYYALLATIL